ncbi:MAG: UDP-N-acetylmuramate--L-alanine ligase [Treponemataceae bacterium]|nr:UDP-N-acetylmuramate--L-alanine ligase [Treponemataceae bacterium]
MSMVELPERLVGVPIHMVGIKGTGMCALAELLSAQGALIRGSDTAEQFYTDAILKELHIPVQEGFSAQNLLPDTKLVIHSAAYDPGSHVELLRAREMGIPIVKYTDALGAYSRRFDSSAVAGGHGKTTTTALVGTILKELNLPAQVLAGSGVSNFNDRSTLILGNTFFVAETCEYRRHFLAFSPRRILLTSVESDHQDYYPTYESIRDAFIEYAQRLPQGGLLIYCYDDAGARDVADRIGALRPDIQRIPYGKTAEGPFGVTAVRQGEECTLFSLRGMEGEFSLSVPGFHTVLNATGAIALVSSLLATFDGKADGFTEILPELWTASRLEALRRGLASFRGSRRRSERIGEAQGILIMDDYAHHPTAIKTTLAGLRAFYPRRRLIVSFMSHTYSRTASLLDEFAASFYDADMVLLHAIYPSARETYTGGVTGKTLFERAASLYPAVYYFDDPLEALPFLQRTLQKGDLFITMGAGDNWKLGRALYEALQSQEETGER